MSINRNRAKLNKAQDNSEYRRLYLRELYPPYDEDCWRSWPQSNNKVRGSRNYWGKKIYKYQYRMYRTWKHNRKTQWKE